MVVRLGERVVSVSSATGRRSGEAEGPRHVADAGPAGSQEHGESAAAEQGEPGGGEEDGEDVRARLADEVGRDPELGLAEDATVVLEEGGLPVPVPRTGRADPERVGGEGQGQRDRRGGSCRVRNGRTDGRTGRRTRTVPIPTAVGRRRVADLAEQPAQPGHDRPAAAAAVGPGVEDDAQEDADRDEPEADDVGVALLEGEWPAGRLAPRRARAGARLATADLRAVVDRLAAAGARLAAAGGRDECARLLGASGCRLAGGGHRSRHFDAGRRCPAWTGARCDT